MSNQAKNEIETLAHRAARADQAHANEAAAIIADLAERFKADTMGKKEKKEFRVTYVTDCAGEIPDGPASGKDCKWTEEQKAADTRARQWLTRAKKAAFPEPKAEGEAEAGAEGEADAEAGAEGKGADQSGREQRVPTPQAAFDALQMAAYKIEDAKARAACQKSLANVAKHLNLDSGE